MMKKRLVTLMMVLCLLSVLTVPAFAAGSDRMSRDRYEEYQAIVEKANAAYGLDIVLCPLGEMDQTNPGTVEGFQTDVDELAEAALFIQGRQGGEEPELGFFQKLFRSLFGAGGAKGGVGDKTVSASTRAYAKSLGMDWTLSPIVTVSTPTGTPDYYIQDVRNADMTPTALPAGYTAEKNGSPWYTFSAGKRQCSVYQQFTLTQNSVSVVVVPWVTVYVDPSTGVLSVGAPEAEETTDGSGAA